MQKTSKSKKQNQNYWMNSSYDLRDYVNDVLNDVEYIQIMSELAGCSMCAAERGNLYDDDNGDDFGDEIDVDQL